MIFGTLKRIFVKNLLVPGEMDTRAYTVEFTKTKHVTAVQQFFVFASQCYKIKKQLQNYDAEDVGKIYKSLVM